MYYSKTIILSKIFHTLTEEEIWCKFSKYGDIKKIQMNFKKNKELNSVLITFYRFKSVMNIIKFGIEDIKKMSIQFIIENKKKFVQNKGIEYF